MSEVEDPFKGLPRRIRVGQFTYKVIIEPSTSEMMTECFGLCDTNELLIHFREDLKTERMLNVVQHEVSHAINNVYGVTDESTEEEFTAQHTNGLNDVLLANPRLDNFLLKLRRAARSESKNNKD